MGWEDMEGQGVQAQTRGGGRGGQKKEGGEEDEEKEEEEERAKKGGGNLPLMTPLIFFHRLEPCHH